MRPEPAHRRVRWQVGDSILAIGNTALMHEVGGDALCEHDLARKSQEGMGK
ncbi:MAG: hypothetical protein ABI629_06560 [bacterium]